MLEMVDIEYIRKKHLIEGWSIRKISRNLSVARQTVREALQNSEIPKYNLTKDKPCPVMNPYKEIVKEWLENDNNNSENHIPPNWMSHHQMICLK